MKKILIILIIGILFIPKVGHANNTQDLIVVKERIDGIYFRKQTPWVLKWHFYGDVLRRNSDNHWVYSIEPGMKLDNKPAAGTNDVSQTTVITNEQWEKVKLYAYYGYNYQAEEQDHSDIKWYIITQLLIWRHLRLDWDIYFTDIYNGNRVIKYENELRELETLIDNHFLIPSFEKDLNEIKIGETLESDDKNNVINQFEVAKTEGLDLLIKDNKLIITANRPGNYKVKLYKKYELYSQDPLIYVSEYLDTMSPGKLSNNEKTIDIIVPGGKITVEGFNNDESLSYLIFDNNNNLVDEIIMNDNFGENSVPLNYGQYYILDNTQNKLFFEINQDNLNHHFIIKDEKEVIQPIDNDITEYDNDITIDQDLNNNLIQVKVPVTYSKVFDFKYMVKEYDIPKIIYYDKKKRKV
ncbi:MAG: Cys-Gln thioester bond-forming surface protein [Bacilli bacterium]|nr:Cys-Gln thioester bond-forming surface protein [Bacilli bacterium]MDD4795000.1 Cys-Gln thioester bond-forming surface protein [Bacilli bacterium]